LSAQEYTHYGYDMQVFLSFYADLFQFDKEKMSHLYWHRGFCHNLIFFFDKTAVIMGAEGQGIMELIKKYPAFIS